MSSDRFSIRHQFFNPDVLNGKERSEDHGSAENKRDCHRIILIDILLRVNAEESHGTAPLGWEFQVCRLPSQHTVGIGE